MTEGGFSSGQKSTPRGTPRSSKEAQNNKATKGDGSSKKSEENKSRDARNKPSHWRPGPAARRALKHEPMLPFLSSTKDDGREGKPRRKGERSPSAEKTASADEEEGEGEISKGKKKKTKKKPAEPERYPYMSPQERDDHAQKIARGSTSTSGTTGSSFLCGVGRGLSAISSSRTRLQEGVRLLQKKVMQDWAETTVVVHLTEQDFVEVSFFLANLESDAGLSAYMSMLCRENELLEEFGLRKVLSFLNCGIINS